MSPIPASPAPRSMIVWRQLLGRDPGFAASLEQLNSCDVLLMDAGCLTKTYLHNDIRKECKWYFQMVKALYRRVHVVGILGRIETNILQFFGV